MRHRADAAGPINAASGPTAPGPPPQTPTFDQGGPILPSGGATLRDLFEAAVYGELLATTPPAADLYARQCGGIPPLWGRPCLAVDTIRVRCIDLFRSPSLDRQTLLALVAWLQDRLDLGQCAVWALPLVEVAAALDGALADSAPRGQSGRRGYPREALEMALALAAADPSKTAKQIRTACLKRFGKDQVPRNERAFRAWLKRPRKK